jgi:predicted ATPase
VDRVESFDAHPLSIPALGTLCSRLKPSLSVIFLVGENGSGKSR